ncbi:transport and Golgi organization protein 6 homolog [Plakobranchus ocellatus]|uniref:Transport and Golgi organization protein 6 homolog n=1 Tax=Plakobranchus ocellatus TaxID=259542 RepID=A0AAV4CGL9_9GAST|nr:transport and Golgi organization protein 6 homolog [Plakobranchus ocellatus]
MESSHETEHSTVLKLSRLFTALHTLTTPGATSPSDREDGSSTLIDKMLEENLHTLSDAIERSAELQEDLHDVVDHVALKHSHRSLLRPQQVNVREKHVELCLCLLYKIHKILDALVNSRNTSSSSRPGVPQLEPGALSAPQIKTLSSSLQFIVVLGICPYLSPGAGIPVSQRLGPGQILLASPCDYGTELTHLTRVQSLLPPTKLMCDMLNVPSLRDIVINHHLHDLLSALFQLRFSTKSAQDQIAKSHNAPKQKDLVSTEPEINSLPENNIGEKSELFVYQTTSSSQLFLYSAEKPWTLFLVREHCNRYIDLAVRLSSTPHVLKTLMMLSGAGKSNSVSVKVKTPAWYKRTVAGLLRDVLMVPNGVQHLIALLVAESHGGHEWQKCKAVAQVIAQLPTNQNNVEQFYKSVTNQLIAIIQSRSDALSPSTVMVVGATVLELSSRQPDLMETLCFTPLFEPLIRISSSTETVNCSESNTVVPESVLTCCIECLHRLYVIGQEPQSPLRAGLGRVTGILFALFVATRGSVSPLRSKCRDLVSVYIGSCQSSEAVVCILTLATGVKDSSLDACPVLHTEVSLEVGQSGGIQAVKQDQIQSQEKCVDSWTQPVEALMDILKTVEVDSLIPQLFLCLLQKLTSIVKSEVLAVTSATGDIVLPTRLLSSTQKVFQLAELREKVCLVSLLASVGETYGDGVVSNGRHVIEFAKATLERCVQICQTSQDDETMNFEWETVSMAMGLLTAVLSAGIEVGDQSKLLDELLPLMNFISESEAADARVREMADDLKVAVATKGLVWAELSQMKQQASQSKQEHQEQDSSKTKQGAKEKNLIEVLSETTLDDEDTKEKTSKLTRVDPSRSRLEQALQELCDPLLPVRGHGLIALARLVEERSPEVKDKQEILLKVFLENLTHSDSYIYLAAVNGLAALSDLCPDQVIPCLTSELRSKCGGSGSDKTPGDLVLKVGEAVVKATRRLGEVTPKYRDILLSSVLCGCRHDDALTRASCLSGLAEVCQLLRFALGPVLYEVVTCCRDVISSDPDPEPRKAAAMTFTLILRGLGKDTIMALDSVLLEVYRILKRAVTQDPEEGVRVQAALALQELDGTMRELLFAKPELSKKISILGLQ